MKFRYADDEVEEIADELIQDAGKHLGHLMGIRKYFLFADEFTGKNATDFAKIQVLSGLTALTLTRNLNQTSFIDPADCNGWVVVINYLMWKLIKDEQTKRYALYKALLGCSEDKDGKPRVKEPEFRIHTEEVSIWGEELPEFKRIQELILKRGQETLPFDAAAPLSSTEDADTSSEDDEDSGDSDDPEEALLALDGPDSGMIALEGPDTGLRQIEARAPLALPDPNVIEGIFREEELCKVCLLESATSGKYCDDCRPRTGLERLEAIEAAALAQATRQEEAVPASQKVPCESCGRDWAIPGEGRFKMCQTCHTIGPATRAAEPISREQWQKNVAELWERFGLQAAYKSAEDEGYGDTPPEVAGFLARTREREYGATEEEVPMVRQSRRRIARGKEGATA